jgi:hypothetical protein
MKKKEVKEALDKINNLKNRIKFLTEKGYNPSFKLSDDIKNLENKLKKEKSVFSKITVYQRILLFLFLCIVILPITIIFYIVTTFNNPIIAGLIITLIVIEIIIMFFLLRFRP